MDRRGKLGELAFSIYSRTLSIEQFLHDEKIPQASFDISSPLEVPLPSSLQKTRDEILEALTDLHALLLGPLPYLMHLMSPAVNVFNSMHVIYEYNVAQHIRADETLHFDKLSERCGIDKDDLRRFLRLAMANHIFREPEPNQVAHTALSRSIVDVPNLHDWIGFVCEDMFPAGNASVEAQRKWLSSKEPYHTGFSISKGTQKGFFDYLNDDPARRARFANSMTLNNSNPALSPRFLSQNLPWSVAAAFPRSLVDVGGSRGHVCLELLGKFPQIEECIVQDLDIITSGMQMPQVLARQLIYEQYDFFREQRRKGADVYLLRMVLHDWPDDYAIRILRNQVAAMHPSSQLILNEVCLPSVGELSLYQEQFLRGFDLSMKTVFNGKERDTADWRDLLARTDSRLEIKQIIRLPESFLSIIQVVLQ